MKKILLCLCLLVGYGMAQDNANSASRDKNGFFLGFELGVTEAGGKVSISGFNVAKMSAFSPMYGFRAGYKGFFNDYVGLAGYVSFRDASTTVQALGYKETGHFMPIMANIDLLYDFYNSQNVSFGAFIGIGLGGAIFSYNGVAPSAIAASFGGSSANIGNKVTTGGFYSDVKIGLSSSFDNNQVSLIASFPIAAMEDKIANIADFSVKQNYAISLAYDYKF